MKKSETKLNRGETILPLQLGVLLVSALVLLVGLAACDQGSVTPQKGTGGPQLSFNETERDFGQINYDKKME